MIIKIGDRVIGTSDPVNRTFTKDVKLSKHLFRKFDAWGIDASYFRDILLEGEYTIIIFEGEESLMYKVTAKEWQKHGRHFHFKTDKIDHGAQTFLSRRFFKQYKTA